MSAQIHDQKTVMAAVRWAKNQTVEEIDLFYLKRERACLESISDTCARILVDEVDRLRALLEDKQRVTEP